MNLYPFDDVIDTARKRMTEGWKIHLQFNCTQCGIKQTFAEENYLSTRGQCEECGAITSLQADGCNLMILKGASD
jgi:uncharacterized protein (DUF983 family)